MKSFKRILLILISGLSLLIGLNEYQRATLGQNSHTNYGLTTINSGALDPQKCTWACHNNTSYCKENHVKFDHDLFPITDRFYFGLITIMQGLGNYGMVNIALLVFLIPFSILFLFIYGLKIQDQLKSLKND
jgi:hypothetical protein